MGPSAASRSTWAAATSTSCALGAPAHEQVGGEGPGVVGGPEQVTVERGQVLDQQHARSGWPASAGPAPADRRAGWPLPPPRPGSAIGGCPAAPAPPPATPADGRSPGSRRPPGSPPLSSARWRANSSANTTDAAPKKAAKPSNSTSATRSASRSWSCQLGVPPVMGGHVRGPQRVDPLAGEGGQQLGLGREVRVDGADGAVELVGDGLHGHATEAVAIDDAAGRGQVALAPGVAASLPPVVWHHLKSNHVQSMNQVQFRGADVHPARSGGISAPFPDVDAAWWRRHGARNDPQPEPRVGGSSGWS